jgi:CRP-like cAMP-binding protein
MRATDTQTSGVVMNLPFFKGLDRDLLDQFLGASDVHAHAKGHRLFSAGDKARKFFVILGGWVKLYRSTVEGEEAVLAIFSTGDVFGEAAVFEEATYPFSAEIAEEARLLEIPASFLKDITKKNPDILNRIMASMSREMHKLQLENEHLSIMTAPQRVGCLLLQLSSHMIGNGGTFTLPYDKSLAAARLGMKPETFSRSLAQLKPFGVGVNGSEVRIDNFGCLMKYVCGHCSMQGSECRGSKSAVCQGKSGCSGNGCH